MFTSTFEIAYVSVFLLVSVAFLVDRGHHFNNISAISYRSVLLVAETDYPKKTTDMPQATDKLYDKVLYGVHLTRTGFELTTGVVIGTDCISSYDLCDKICK